MGSSVDHRLLLDNLTVGLPGLTPAMGQTFAEACMVCLDDRGHAPNVLLKIEGEIEEHYHLFWSRGITDTMRNAWDDEPYTTEQAAYGVAVLIILEFTDYTVIRRARKRTGVDWFLGYKDALLLANAARLEVSGLRTGTRSEFKARIKQKVEQTKPTDGSHPAYIIVTEFSQPISHVVLK